MSDKETNRNRATMAPGGCECSKCGCIFIGGVEHDLCGVCADKANEVPSGWKLVPIEPTAEMKIAGDNAGFWCGDKWRAMLAAAPQPASEQQAARELAEDSDEVMRATNAFYTTMGPVFKRMRAALLAAKGDGHAD